MLFPILITYFCEQAGLVPDEGDRIMQMDGLLNSRTFNDISTQRNEEAGRAAAAVEEAEDAAEEYPSVVPAGDRRPYWVDELFKRQDAMETRQTALEKTMTNLTKAI
ncbi:hypothetical protein LWI28_012964 [Acer negundo]|uniref:Uncharacterized protein n=1 Tax=Acer negundo TaxID=4023 RepID=A0AAD5JE67_ACENE|nr:hypothetical protein LWI28_012964 [Acer negundo]KAK4855968.1 hypothetical protein QYF36_012844 [Acer negundo]